MTMATLNILSPSPMTNSSFKITNCSRTYHNLYYNNINIKCKHLFFPNDSHFSVVSSLFSQTKSNPSLKSSPMPTHFSKSGIFFIIPFTVWFIVRELVISYMVLVMVEFEVHDFSSISSSFLNLLWFLFLRLEYIVQLTSVETRFSFRRGKYMYSKYGE